MLRRAILVLLILICPVWANGAIRNETFKLSGFGGYVVAPAEFDGSMTAGTLFPGTFVIDIDDVIWPVDNPGTPQNERWNYIFATYFKYDNSQPGAAKWTAYFPPLPAQLPVVTWSFYHNGDKLGGILQSLIVTISDKNGNGVVDAGELTIQAVAGNLVAHIEQGTGLYEGYCGQGSMNGTLEGYDLSQPSVLTISTGNVLLRNFSCAVGVEERSWGAVKEMYSE
jgi:hypothetical protein